MKKLLSLVAVLLLNTFTRTNGQEPIKITDKLVPSIQEDIPVYRIELRIITAGGSWDGTDNEVYVQLNGSDKVYFLDYGRDDFGRNADQRFDIISESICTIKDIQFIKLGVKRDDQWAITKVELYLNNSTQAVFSKSYNPKVILNEYPGQKEEFLIPSADLRVNSKWLLIPQNAGLKALPVPVKFTMISSIVESMVGNQLHQNGDTRLQWGSNDDKNTVWGPWVEGEYSDQTKLHFDLDLEYSINNSPDAEIDVDFDLVFECTNGNVIIKTTNVNISCTYLGIDCQKIVSALNSVISLFGVDPIRFPSEKANNFTRMFSIGGGANKCHSITVTGAGDVVVL